MDPDVSMKPDDSASGREKVQSVGGDDFFSVGTPLHAVKAGYVKRRADEQLFEAVVAGRYAHVIAPARSGKSSLVAATAARLEANGFNVAILDLNQIGEREAGSDPGRWYYSIAYRILRQLRIRYDLQSWWQDKSVLGNRQRLLEFYNEIVLQFVQERITIFIDGIECVGRHEVGEQLLSSIRSAHNARTTDPDFSRLTFVVLGECDPASLISEAELSPFNVAQPVSLDDFSRDDMNLFAAELNLTPDNAEKALDRIYHWTGGQPYLTQKLARATARERLTEEIAENVDRLVGQQLTGRDAIRNEPHLSHIHRELVGDSKQREALLNLYGSLRKGVDVSTDMGSPMQRRLIALGLLIIDENGELRVRNRVYETVFTARWANENLPTRWRVPLSALGFVLLILLAPLWYTQWLPGSYVSVLTSPDVELDVAESAWLNYRSFPGHADSADNIYRNFLQSRAAVAATPDEIEAVADRAAGLPDAGQLPDEFRAAFWDRRVREAGRVQDRDAALLASLQSLVLSTPQRRRRAAMLVGEDYPLLLATLPGGESQGAVFDAENLLLTSTRGSQVLQWSLTPQGLQRPAEWVLTALEVSPLVRRVIIDREGAVNRIGLTLNISHPRMNDLRIKLIAPSGRAVEIETGLERASSSDEIRIPAAQVRDLVGEALNGTWSLSVRDEALGVAGHLVGWKLTLNSQAAIEDFQRGLQISDPVERETDSIWISDNGRYAIARALQSDSARVWDLAFAKPIRAVAVGQNETLIGLDNGARQLLTATTERVNVWDTATGDRIREMAVGPGSESAQITRDGQHLFVQRRGDVDTRLELWSLETGEVRAQLDIAGAPALIALDAAGSRIAVADFDRAVRVWNFGSGEMLAQIDLPMQPSVLELTAGGEVLGVVYGESGIAAWNISRPGVPMFEERGAGQWQIAMSPSGTSLVGGSPGSGYQIVRTSDGRPVGPPLGAGGSRVGLLGFSADERVLLTSAPGGGARFWRIPVDVPPVRPPGEGTAHSPWAPSANAVVITVPDASAILVGDRGGHLHRLPGDVSAEVLAATFEEVSFVGHDAAIRLLAASPDGSAAASAAEDDTVRVWEIDTGQPRPFMADVAAGTIHAMAFSPDAKLLAVLSGTQALLLDAYTGETIVEFATGEVHSTVAFAPDNRVYIGSESGALRVLAQDAAGGWELRQLWQGTAAIRWLRASPRGRNLVLVDQADIAQMFSLGEGRIGELTVALPDRVLDIEFDPAGSRVYFRTTHWIQRLSVSVDGLIWRDAIFVPKAVPGAGMVVRNDGLVHVPAARAHSIGLINLQFPVTEGPGLFGSRDELIMAWRGRLGLSVRTQAPPAEPQAVPANAVLD
jgi:WD40 repeat protein/plasmid stabilization system protein ParE